LSRDVESRFVSLKSQLSHLTGESERNWQSCRSLRWSLPNRPLRALLKRSRSGRLLVLPVSLPLRPFQHDLAQHLKAKVCWKYLFVVDLSQIAALKSPRRGCSAYLKISAPRHGLETLNGGIPMEFTVRNWQSRVLCCAFGIILLG